MSEKQADNNIESITDTIIGNQDITIKIPLVDLVWTIVIFSDKMVDLEDKIFKDDSLSLKEKAYFLRQKEYYACRRDELSRLISQYSDFDTEKIWKEVDKMFKAYGDDVNE